MKVVLTYQPSNICMITMSQMKPAVFIEPRVGPMDKTVQMKLSAKIAGLEKDAGLNKPTMYTELTNMVL